MANPFDETDAGSLRARAGDWFQKIAVPLVVGIAMAVATGIVTSARFEERLAAAAANQLRVETTLEALRIEVQRTREDVAFLKAMIERKAASASRTEIGAANLPAFLAPEPSGG